MPFAYVVAWLERDKGYHRDEIRSLTRGYVNGILNWPAKPDGTLQKPPARQEAADAFLSEEERLERHYFMRGWPPHRIPAKVREIMAAREQQRQAAQMGG